MIGGKVGLKLEKLSFSQGSLGQLSQFFPRNIYPLFDPNYPSFYLKCPKQCQKTYNSDTFSNTSQILGKFLIIPPMCILLKLDDTEFGVSNLCFSKVVKEKPLGGGSISPLW